jgi:phage portal protein BeeE
MHIVPTTWIEPYAEKPGMPQTGWVITPEGDYTRRQIVALEDVEFLRYKSPLSKWDGFSPLQGGSRWTENAESIEMSRTMQFRNGGNPDVLVELDGQVHGTPSPELISRIKESVMQRSSGLRRHGEPLISPPGVKYSKWSNTPREMDYETSATQARDAVLALRGTPKVLFGITEDVNRASIEGANIIAGQNLDPKAAYIAGFFQERILARFGDGFCMWFDSAVPQDAAEQRAEQQFQFSCGALSPDEIRINSGLEPWGTPASETGYLPAGLMPLDPEALPEPPEDDAGPDTGEDPPEDPEDDPEDEA